MLFHRCSPARSSSQNLNGFSTGSWQSVHKSWQHLLHCKIILLFLTCADVSWWWRNYAKGLARLASPSLAETNVQLSHLSVLYSCGARKRKKTQKCAKSVQFHTFFFCPICKWQLTKCESLDAKHTCRYYWMQKKKQQKLQQQQQQNITVHPQWTWWVVLLAHQPVWQKQWTARLFSDVGVSDRAHGWVTTKKTPSTH